MLKLNSLDDFNDLIDTIIEDHGIAFLLILIFLFGVIVYLTSYPT